MTFYLGCAIWSYRGWLGEFYPPKSQSRDLLSLYSQRLTAVEGNTTFYAVPDAETVERWRQQTPACFQFCPKLPKAITHQGLLQPSVGQALRFLAHIGKLEERLGPILVQLPPNYSPEYLEDLTAFLTVIHNYKLALEVRHPDWFQEPYASQLAATLKQFQVGQVLLDTRPIYSSSDPHIESLCRKPHLPLEPKVTTDFSLIRFISHPQPSFNQSFLEEWVKQVDSWLRQDTQIYFFVHCPFEERSPHTARYFQQLLEEYGAPVPPLPWNQIEAPPRQLSLF